MDEGILKRRSRPSLIFRLDGFSSTLTENWRSGREIVEFNNRFWLPDNIRQTVDPDFLQEAVAKNFSGAQQCIPKERGETGFISISIRIAEKNRDESDEEESEGEEEALHCLRESIDAALARGISSPGHRHPDPRTSRAGGSSGSWTPAVSPAFPTKRCFYPPTPKSKKSSLSSGFLDYPPDDLNFCSFLDGEIFGREFRRRSPARPIISPIAV